MCLSQSSASVSSLPESEKECTLYGEHVDDPANNLCEWSGTQKHDTSTINCQAAALYDPSMTAARLNGAGEDLIKVAARCASFTTVEQCELHGNDEETVAPYKCTWRGKLKERSAAEATKFAQARSHVQVHRSDYWLQTLRLDETPATLAEG